MRVLRASGAMVLGLILTYGIWLLATPDADGGRQAMGRSLVGLVAFMVVFVIVRYAVIRLRRHTKAALTRALAWASVPE
jgi:hypothetical protein